MTVTTVFPAMVTKVIAAFKASSALTGVRIFDGLEIDESYPGDAIAVGHDGSLGDTELQAGNIRNTPLNFTDQHQEDGVIGCSLWAQSGSSDLTTLRTRAFQLLSAADTAIRLDPTFGGTCFYAYLESNSVNYRQTTQGGAVVLNFSISYQAQS